MQLPYNPNDKKSIIDFAKKLKDKSLREVCNASILDHTYTGKGNFGQILEKYYFLYEPNSISEADFPLVSLELKSSPLKKLQSGDYKSKERLVLNIINFFDIIHQTFDNSSFWRKNSNLLLVFYLYQQGQDILDIIIRLVDEWSFPDTDLEIIKKDWEIIKKKVVAGKAHELSEGDTFYLGACTKGGKGGNLKGQPNSDRLAKQRAYSLKQGYVNHIIGTIASVSDVNENYGRIIHSKEIAKSQGIENIVISRFEKYYGKTITEILNVLDKQLNISAKNFYSSLTKLILGIELNKHIEEFEKADIEVKTVRLKENNLPKEDISFPTFKYQDIINENWDESKIKNIFEHKFLFVFFKYINNELVLEKVKFWNMPYNDIQEVKKVWKKTKEIIENGNIVHQVRGNKRLTNFPNKKFNSVAHVRPHAKNAADTYPLPTTDIITQQTEYTKHCFWLNNTYVRDKIYLK